MTDMSEPLTPSLLQERSEFYLMLAQAFLPPKSEEHFRAVADFLADDLADLDTALGYGIGGELEALRHAMSRLGTQEALLVEYSRLFLQPPREATLNVCYALDGAMNGGTVSEIENFYREHGVDRGEHFKDLPDHVAVQLEFVAYLFGRSADGIESGAADAEAEKGARHFLFQYVSRWLPHFELALETGGRRLELANPWLPLTRMLAAAVARDAAPNADWIREKKRVDVAMDKARQMYAAKGITPEALADIERKLREQGLATDHLQIAPESRDAVMGLTAKTPPDPRRK
jgi:TorA maturation chaperone TorD